MSISKHRICTEDLCELIEKSMLRNVRKHNYHSPTIGIVITVKNKRCRFLKGDGTEVTVKTNQLRRI